jgi:DNA-binding transcriptional LysR family regulator
MESWDDLRVVVAVARSGSLSGAARELGVHHATVFRRLGAIEHRLGLAAFLSCRATSAPKARS